jgi:outer membrane lipase/esterase
VHPTIAGQQLIADYAYSILSAPWELTLLPEMAHASLRAHQDELRNQWQTPWQAVGQWQAFVATGARTWTSTASTARPAAMAAATT